MRNTLRKRIINGLYEDEFISCLKKGYSFKKTAEILKISDYAIFACKWHLYQKFQVWSKKELLEKINNIPKHLY